MKIISQKLRDEHKVLVEHLDTLLHAADSLDDSTLTDTIRETLDDAYLFLIGELVPHSRVEDRVIYPVIQRIMGSSMATETMSFDHREIESLIQQMVMQRSLIVHTKLSRESANSLRRVIYGLYTLVKVHIAKEEEVYFPLLDVHLKPEEAESLLAAIDALTDKESSVEPQTA
jgi:iron-sulfur cluster repair protein YtfE (RIC family)